MMLFNLMEIFVPAMFVLVVGLMVVMVIRNMAEWSRNNASPRLSSPATVVAKRQHHYSHNNGGGGTTYYATFEFESGDRMELRMSGREAGLLAEGDRGMLHFQGTRYLGFDRQ